MESSCCASITLFPPVGRGDVEVEVGSGVGRGGKKGNKLVGGICPCGGVKECKPNDCRLLGVSGILGIPIVFWETWGKGTKVLSNVSVLL